MSSKAIIGQLGKLPTPFYYYDTDILNKTFGRAKTESDKYGYVLHYALKAN